MTSHDWITTGSTPWNQKAIRAAQAGRNVTGFWHVKVWKAGEYAIRLRRWPQESDQAIRAELAPGDDVPGTKAYRTQRGVAINAVRATISIADVQLEKPVLANDKEVVFRVTLPAGRGRFSARFLDDAGKEFGAYYAYVERIED